MKQAVIGIFAHVDSGKTTLSEAMLYTAGALRKLGRVDHGDAFLDTDNQERSRGITIFSKQAVLPLPDLNITLLDTPGHVDFSPEMERTLQVLDYAILVISGPGGVQSHTQTLWRLLHQHEVPTFLFINKMDLPGPGKAGILDTLRNQLSDKIVDFTPEQFSEEALDALALCHEDLMEEYLSAGTIQDEHIRLAIRNRSVFPCCFGSALKLEGIGRFLRILSDYSLSPVYPETFGARVFKIARDSQGNRLTYLKVTGGNLPVRASIQGAAKSGEPWEEKISALRVYSGAKFTAIDAAPAGTVVAAVGLSQTYPGMGLGFEEEASLPLLQPVLTYKVILPEGTDPHTALQKFRLLEEEEPQLHVTWNELLGEIRVQLMGRIQLEIMKNLLLERFGMDVSFTQGSILYQETIENTVEGVGHYEPLRHYAEVHLLLEPMPRGSGLTIENACDPDYFDKNYQHLVLTHIQEKTHLGVLTGAPITDMKITLMSGKSHLKHSEGGDFRQATYRAIRQGLMQAKSVLLEPWYAYRLEVPAENVGRAISDLQRMGGDFTQETMGDRTVLTGRAPVAKMQDYALEAAGYSHGLAQFSICLEGYAPCTEQEAVVAAAGYDPEADLPNTPDSVFCSHGAGTVVKWNEVPSHMHLPSCLNSPAPAPPEKSWEQRAREYVSYAATDQELKKIFERTYGPIRRTPQTAMHTQRSASPTAEKKRSPILPPAGPEYLLVDGYNIIFAWDDLNALAQDSLEAARDQLTQMLVNYQGVRQCRLILVFDAYKVKNNPGSLEKVGGIDVVYTKEAETADMYIERVTHQLGKGKKVRVATSDGLEQMIILGHGALRVPARSFRTEVDEAIATIRDFLEHQDDPFA